MTMTSSGPTFRGPSDPPDVESGDPTLQIDARIRRAMLAAFEKNGIPDTRRNRELYLEAEDLKAAFTKLDVPYERILPTSDGQGHVRLDFEAAWALIDLIEPDTSEEH